METLREEGSEPVFGRDEIRNSPPQINNPSSYISRVQQPHEKESDDKVN